MAGRTEHAELVRSDGINMRGQEKLCSTPSLLIHVTCLKQLVNINVNSVAGVLLALALYPFVLLLPLRLVQICRNVGDFGMRKGQELKGD